MLPNAIIQHQIKNRVRLSIPSQQRNSEFFKRVKEEMTRCQEVRQIYSNPLTGTLLILYDGKSSQISEFAIEKKLFKILPRSQTKSNPLGTQLWQSIEKIDTKLDQLSDGTLRIKQLTAFGLLGAAIFQFYQKKIFPPAMTLISEAVWILSKNPQQKGERIF